MSLPPSFVPQAMLELPHDFGVEAEVTWRPARSLDEAVRLSRAIDQHAQAVAVSRLLRLQRHSVTDLAGVLGERPETLAAKLRGRRPAPEADLVLWSWLTGASRQHRPLAELVTLPGDADPVSLLPVLPIPARQKRGKAERAAAANPPS